MTLDLHAGKTGAHPVVSPTIDLLSTWMGKMSAGTVMDALNGLERKGIISTARGRNGARNSYRFQRLGPTAGPVPCPGPAPLVERVAYLPYNYTTSTGERTLLVVMAVAQGTAEHFTVSRADLFKAARLSHSQGTELFKALKRPRTVNLLGKPVDVPPYLTLLESGHGPRPSTHQLILPTFSLPKGADDDRA
ncbi:hypothetical protein [Micrococcus luteus]|uniref:hypothetical protein n=1 Tax=Micrococcus luteus TaxID=1270 RepID=UPI00368B48DB